MDISTRCNVFSVIPLIQQMEDVIPEEENCEILQTDLIPMEYLVQYIITVLDQLPEAARETLVVWLQLLHIFLTEAKSILHRSDPPQRCLDCLRCNPRRLSKQIKKWRVRFNYLFQALERDFSVFVSGREAVIAPVIAPVISLMKDVIQEEENCHILQTELRPVDNLLLDINDVFQYQQKTDPEALKIRLQLLHNSLTEANRILHCYGPSQRQRRLDGLMCNPGRPSKEVKEWQVLFEGTFQRLQAEFSIFCSARQFINRDQQSINRDPIQLMSAQESIEGQSLSTDEEEESIEGQPLSTDRAFQLLKCCYDALPNSDVKNCFLYCAMYPAGRRIYVQELVQMWIAEGLVRSKQESHLMDMAIGHSYVNLLVDRCLFQWDTDSSVPIQWGQYIFVEDDIREMAIYIGEKEENCLFKASQSLHNFPTIHNDEDCKRISLLENDIQYLPAELPCPKLVSLLLSVDDDSIPSRFLVCLTSLKVLQLHSNLFSHSRGAINSIPSSVGPLKQVEFLQLKQLEFLSLQGLDMEGLPEAICHLSSLQFLDLHNCTKLQSLPPKIGELKNLKYLSLVGCYNLKIPHEISQLTSLTTLDAFSVLLSVEAESESEASIWSLKGLGNLTMLRTLRIKVNGFKEGIMGKWLDMRHLRLVFDDGVKADLPHDMTKMTKLQSFQMWSYSESSLPDYSYKFQHLEDIYLDRCSHLRELSPLERLPSLKGLFLHACDGLKELGIGFSGRPSGFLMLEKLVLTYLGNLESIAGPLNNGVWNESTLPKLRILKIHDCPKLKRFPMGTDKLLNLSMIGGAEEWWHNLIWEDHDMQVDLEKKFKEWRDDSPRYF